MTTYKIWHIPFVLLFVAATCQAQTNDSPATGFKMEQITLNEITIGETARWDGKNRIELYNGGDSAVKLTGWSLESAQNKTRAQLDSLTIAAKGYLVLTQQKHFKFDICPWGDVLTLRKGNKQVDRIAFGTLEGATLGREQDGKGGNDTLFENGTKAQQGWRIYEAADATLGGANNTVSFIYTSDPHYGTTRTFHKQKYVDAGIVNGKMVEQMNRLHHINLPTDGGAGEGKPMQIAYVIQTGDIANRSSGRYPYPTAKTTMAQFDYDYYTRLNLRNLQGHNPEVLLSPGNHDISNLIGHLQIPVDSIDGTAVIEIYNRMMQPVTPKTAGTFNVVTDKVNYIRTIGDVQFVFVQMWPDEANRAWIAANMRTDQPAIIFTHDQPDVEAKHLLDPAHAAGTPYLFDNRFENLIDEKADTEINYKGSTATQQRQLATFIKAHPNIKAYFHGNYNYNEFYTYRGPDNDIALPTIRVDSSMKGARTANDETKLSFQVVTIDRFNRALTVREVLWNTTADANAPIVFGDSFTLQL